MDSRYRRKLRDQDTREAAELQHLLRTGKVSIAIVEILAAVDYAPAKDLVGNQVLDTNTFVKFLLGE